jgi:hypothetical protein
MGSKNVPLLLILPFLPESVSRKEIRRFVRDGLAESGYSRLTRLLAVTRSTILSVTDPCSGKREYHGLVEVKPAKAAMDAIEILKGKELRGTKIEVRRFQQRSGIPVENGSYLQLRERRREDLKLDILDL